MFLLSFIKYICMYLVVFLFYKGEDSFSVRLYWFVLFAAGKVIVVALYKPAGNVAGEFHNNVFSVPIRRTASSLGSTGTSAVPSDEESSINSVFWRRHPMVYRLQLVLSMCGTGWKFCSLAARRANLRTDLCPCLISDHHGWQHGNVRCDQRPAPPLQDQ